MIETDRKIKNSSTIGKLNGIGKEKKKFQKHSTPSLLSHFFNRRRREKKKKTVNSSHRRPIARADERRALNFYDPDDEVS